MINLRTKICTLGPRRRVVNRSSIAGTLALLVLAACDQGAYEHDELSDERGDQQGCDLDQSDVEVFCEEFGGHYFTMQTHINQNGEPAITNSYVDVGVTGDGSVLANTGPVAKSSVQFAVECNVEDMSVPSVRLRSKQRFNDQVYLSMDPFGKVTYGPDASHDNKFWIPEREGSLWSFENLDTAQYMKSDGIWRQLVSDGDASPATRMLIQIRGPAE